VSGLAVAIGALAQALARLSADHFVERHTPRAVARVLLVAVSAVSLGSLKAQTR
jgi:hypothetical protein